MVGASGKRTPRRHLKISNAAAADSSKDDAAGNQSNKQPESTLSSSKHPGSRRGRKDKVHPSGVHSSSPSGAVPHKRNNHHHSSIISSNKNSSTRRSSRAMAENGGSSGKEKSSNRSPVLTVDTRNDGGTDGDLRSPGVPRTPLVAQAAQLPQGHSHIPDFITQTDASGKATTPRSAQAIDGARKVHPSGPKPKLHVDRRGKLSEDDDDDDVEGKDDSDVDETCESLVDSLRLMCCCLLPPEATNRCIPGKTDTEDSDDKSRIKLLGPHHPDDTGKKCLVLDLDETLVHSSFRAVPGADFVIPVQIEDVVHFVYVMKRPGVDEFLVEMAKHYEIVIYTASLNKYADPLLDLLDPKKVIRARLFRESCVFYEGNYVKDLSLLDRELTSTIIIDNSPSSYMFHPENAIDCSSFIDDPRDRELDQIGAFLAGIKDAKDVRGICNQWREWPVVNPTKMQ